MDYEKIEKAAQRRNRTIKIITYTLLTLWAILVLFPFYWMVLTSVKSYGAYNAEWIPQLYTLSPTLQNYADAFTQVPLAGYFTNTILFTVATTALMLVVTVLAAFAFARLNFRGKDLAFTLFLSLMMIPSELVVITNYVTITNWDMRNTFAGLILPSVTSVFYIYLLKENFAQIPDELYYAAKVDGTSKWRIFTKITLPMISPPLFYLLITGFIGAFKAYSDAVALFGTDLNAAEMNTIVGYIYDRLYGNGGGFPSYASAAAIILFAIVLTITCINLLVSRNHVHYD